MSSLLNCFLLPQKQLLNWYDEVDTACESSSHNDDGEFDSDADCDPFASSSTDREQCNLLPEEIDEISLANTDRSDDEYDNGDTTEDIDENPLEQNMDDNNMGRYTSLIPNLIQLNLVSKLTELRICCQ
ncbi:hypothetical protein QE152_g23336 [Popillia japonica]|uniref:Uncharacterized protein n=1 Tax=Popillia japonica TaxID=7064 RepID=A0AAW1KJA8_POPJA